MLRFIKLGVFSVILIFGLLWLISLQFPSRIIVSRAISIQAGPRAVRAVLDDMENWTNWNRLLPDSAEDFQMIAPGHLKGRQVDISMQPIGDTLHLLWRQDNGKMLKGGFVIHNGPDSTVSVLQWFFEFHLRWYPWEKFGSIVFDKQLGPAMEVSLENFKKQSGDGE